jgi:hypothetical protein
MRRRLIFSVLLLLAFAFRLLFGLCSDLHGDDPKQIYLLGLKFYTTGTWPYFGPDVTQTIQIPGALQAVVVGLPFYLLRMPEAPFLILNLLTFASLCFFAWYCCERLPQMPRWFVWGWLLTAPWTLDVGTNIFNPSYVLPAAILFFVATIETYPFLSQGIIKPRQANFMMGFALFWIMQFHLSWVVLVPYVLLSVYFQWKGDQSRKLGWFALGAMIPLSFLIPTFIKYGWSQGLGGASGSAAFNPDNLRRHLNIVEGVLGRFLSFASFELPRFLGDNTATRLAFLKAYPWLIPFAAFLTIVGILQTISLVIFWFRRNHQPDWKAIKYFSLATVLLLYVSFLFSIKAPVSHTFYLTLPVSMLYAFYCWSPFLQRRFWQRFAFVLVVCGLIFHVGLAWANFRHVSLYTERDKIEEALHSQDYRKFGERRAGARY